MGLFSFGTTKVYQDIDVSKFADHMKEQDAVIVDVRTPGEIADGKIMGALEMDVNDPSFPERVAKLDRDKKYLVYCRSGRRSAVACDIMHQVGCNTLYNLKGGYISWTKNGNR